MKACIEVYTFTALGAAGSISVPGVKVGQFCVAYYSSAGLERLGQDPGSGVGFEAQVSVADEIQQLGTNSGTWTVIVVAT